MKLRPGPWFLRSFQNGKKFVVDTERDEGPFLGQVIASETTDPLSSGI